MVVSFIIVVVLGVYAYLGYRRGFVTQFAELLIFVLSFALAMLVYQPLGGLVEKIGSLPDGISDLLAFLTIWLGLELVLGFAWRKLKTTLPTDLSDSAANQIGGVVPALLRGLFLITVLLLIVASAPLPSAARDPILNAPLAKPFLSFGTGLQQQFNSVFGKAFQDTLAFRTIKPGTDENLALGFTTTNVKICRQAELDMIDSVNKERQTRGLSRLGEDVELREVGRAHSRDMLARGFFAHNNPDGKDPFDRMREAGITYEYAGENLAFAPNVDIAHTGLMNSPGHRANILKPEYRLLGVGCIDAGIRGKMFSQEFKG